MDGPTLKLVRPVQSKISDFGFELQDSSNFKIPPVILGCTS